MELEARLLQLKAQFAGLDDRMNKADKQKRELKKKQKYFLRVLRIREK